MNKIREERLRKLRIDYRRLLDDTFCDKNAQELAELSVNPNYENFVSGYVGHIKVAFPGFRSNYERARKSILEQRAQSQHSPIPSQPKFFCGFPIERQASSSDKKLIKH